MGAMQGVAATVSREVAAPLAVVWALVTDIENLARFSPETTKTEWVDGATAAAVGARFKGTNKVRFMQWSTTPEITALEVERRFAFKVPATYGAEWTYELAPTATGTRVTETVQQDAPMPLPIRVLLRLAGVTDRSAHLQAGMETTSSGSARRRSGPPDPQHRSGQAGAVLFTADAWDGLRDGTITVAFRWWKRPTVKAGGTLLSAGGQLGIDSVDPWTVAKITKADAKASGHATKEDLLDRLGSMEAPGKVLYRVAFHRIGEDPRLQLRQSDLTPDVLTKLDRMDARAEAPWTRAYLRAIGDHPGLHSQDLADLVGYERFALKERVRKLKALGLTESLKVGYQLSPRGQAVLDAG